MSRYQPQGHLGRWMTPPPPGWGQYPVHPTAAHPNPVVLVHGLADHVATAGGQRVLRLRNGLRPRPGYRPTAGRGSPLWADALVMGTGSSAQASPDRIVALTP